MNAFTKEPAVVTGGVMGLFAAVITCLTVFNVIRLSGEQELALAALAVIVLPPLQGWITRQYVRPASLSVPKPLSHPNPQHRG